LQLEEDAAAFCLLAHLQQ